MSHILGIFVIQTVHRPDLAFINIIDVLIYPKICGALLKVYPFLLLIRCHSFFYYQFLATLPEL